MSSASASTSASHDDNSSSSANVTATTVNPDNYALVEGPWGDFNFRKVDREDWPSVVKHVQKCYMRDEPTCQLLGYSDDFGDEFQALIKQMMVDGLSFLVEHKETGELAAVRITFRHKKTTSFDNIPVSSYAGSVMWRLMKILKKMSHLHAVYGVEEFAEFFLTSCAPKFRQLGISSELYRRSLLFLKAEGFKLVKGVFTNPHSIRVVSKLGFKEVCRLDYREFIDDMGQMVFTREELTDDNYAVVMVKELQ